VRVGDLRSWVIVASVACCLLSRPGVFSIDLCPAGEKRVKFEEVHVYILHSPPPVLGGGGGFSGTASGPATGLFNQSCAETVSPSLPYGRAMTYLFRGFETQQEPVGPVFSTTRKCPLQLREFRRPEGLILTIHFFFLIYVFEV